MGENLPAKLLHSTAFDKRTFLISVYKKNGVNQKYGLKINVTIIKFT